MLVIMADLIHYKNLHIAVISLNPAYKNLTDNRVRQYGSTMLKLLVLLVAVAAVWGLPRADKPSFQRLARPISRIIGGHDADIADYPYQLALIYAGNFACGAVLIDSKWALTAAHCTYWTQVNGLQVIAGATDLTGGQTVQVAAVYEHPKFDRPTLDYDISVLKLAEDVTVANSAPIALHDGGYTAEEGAAVTITGWGVQKEGGPISDVLKVVVTKVVNNEVCNEAYKGFVPVTDRMVCAGNLDEGGESTCSGDNGGPVVVDGKLYGVVSWGLWCGEPGYPGLVSRITQATMREFITKITGL